MNLYEIFYFLFEIFENRKLKGTNLLDRYVSWLNINNYYFYY
jgi:hypothetical protein